MNRHIKYTCPKNKENKQLKELGLGNLPIEQQTHEFIQQLQTQKQELEARTHKINELLRLLKVREVHSV